jgi:hypothetical protein
MAKKSGVKMNITQLKVIQTALTKMVDGGYSIQVGIFGNKDARPKDKEQGVTNAEVGIIHEMGSFTKNIPRRSFLWDTFANHGAKLLPVLKKPCEDLFKKGKVEEYLKIVGIAATNLVIEAFETSGFGAWPQTKYANIMHKLRRLHKNIFKRKQLTAEVMFEGATHSKPLINTGQLWQSISSRTARS